MRNILVIMLLGSGGLAFAGARQTSDVTVSSGSASGAVGDAYNSADKYPHIGCTVDSGGWTTCSAQDRLTHYASCTTSSFFLAAAAASIRQSSFVYFAFDEKQICTRIDVTNSSYYQGKVQL